MERPAATVALIGRSNVGKSTLFNRLVGTNTALIDTRAGTTRDRQTGIVYWRDRRFTLIDCGGLDLPNNTELQKNITEQAKLAIQQANIILLIVDTKDGLLPDDKKLAKQLRRLPSKKIMVVANKADRADQRAAAAEFSSLGLGEVWPISALNGSGIGDMLDEIHQRLKTLRLTQASEPETAPLKIVLLGKTNVGKSSIANSLLGQQRLVVSSQPHTTRTAISVNLVDHGQLFELTDTAGLNRHSGIDFFDKKTEQQTLNELNKCDVALLITDASQPLTHQDRHLAGLVADIKCGLIIVANKWDLLPNKTTVTAQDWQRAYRAQFPFLTWAPIVFASALTKQGVKSLLDVIRQVNNERERHITDNALSRILKQAIIKQRPLINSGRGKPFLHDFKQTGIKPPRFVLQVRAAAPLAPAYVRYLQNFLRQKFGFLGTPIYIDLQQQTMGGGRVKQKFKPPIRRR